MTYIALLIIGSILIAFGTYLVGRNQGFLMNGKKTKAFIYSFKYERGDKYPIMKYTTEENSHFKVIMRYYTTEMTEGDEYEILYDPADPEKFVLSGHIMIAIYPRLIQAFGFALVLAFILIATGIMD